MGKQTLSKPSSQPSAQTHPSKSPDVIAFRLPNGGNLAYVTPPEDEEQARQYAKSVFTQELHNVDPQRLSFSLTVTLSGEKRTVIIGRMAWKAVMSRLQQYEIVDVTILPPSSEPPPQYDDTNREGRDEKSQYLFVPPTDPSSRRCRTRSPSPAPGMTGRVTRLFRPRSNSDSRSNH